MEIKFSCPLCGARMHLPAAMAGRPVYCVQCKSPLRVPGADGAAAVPDSSPSAADAVPSRHAARSPLPHLDRVSPYPAAGSRLWIIGGAVFLLFIAAILAWTFWPSGYRGKWTDDDERLILVIARHGKGSLGTGSGRPVEFTWERVGTRIKLLPVVTGGTRAPTPAYCSLDRTSGELLFYVNATATRAAMRFHRVGTTVQLSNEDSEDARKSVSLANLKQLILAVMLYAQDHRETLPPSASDSLLRPYARKTFAHPVTGEPYRTNPAVFGKPLRTYPRPSEVPVFYEGSVWSDGTRNVAFLDGRVTALSPTAWGALQARWRLP